MRRPVAVIEGSVNSAAGSGETNDRHHRAGDATPRGKVGKWAALRWSFGGFAIGIVFWHLVGFWDFLHDVVLYENPQAATMNSDLATAVAAERRESGQLAAAPLAAKPVVTSAKIAVAATGYGDKDCVALIKQNNGIVASGPCTQAVAGMRASIQISKGDLVPNETSFALAKPAPPSWDTKLVEPAPRLVVQFR